MRAFTVANEAVAVVALGSNFLPLGLTTAATFETNDGDLMDFLASFLHMYTYIYTYTEICILRWIYSFWIIDH